MNVPNFNRSRWRRKTPTKSLFFSISLLILFLFFVSYTEIPISLLTSSEKTIKAEYPQCSRETIGERFLWFAPHSGFSNQLAELKNAILIAAILNRTLIVPPVLDHHAVALGSCPKFRVSTPKEIRTSVWNHIIELLQSRRHVNLDPLLNLRFPPLNFLLGFVTIVGDYFNMEGE